jgi:hypothetical protein
MVQQLKGKLEINADFIKDQRLTIGVTPQQLAEGGLTFEERANEANETNRKVIAPLQKLNDMSSMAQERIERQLKVEAQENQIAAVAKNTKKEKIVKKKKSKPAAVFVQDDNADVDMGEAVDEQEDEVGILELSDSD